MKSFKDIIYNVRNVLSTILSVAIVCYGVYYILFKHTEDVSRQVANQVVERWCSIWNITVEPEPIMQKCKNDVIFFAYKIKDKDNYLYVKTKQNNDIIEGNIDWIKSNNPENICNDYKRLEKETADELSNTFNKIDDAFDKIDEELDNLSVEDYEENYEEDYEKQNEKYKKQLEEYTEMYGGMSLRDYE